MDGFEANEGVILIAATNRPDVLDPALLRPAASIASRRANPDVVGREKILKVHMRKVPLATDVDPRIIARARPVFRRRSRQSGQRSGADGGAPRQALGWRMSEFEHAKDKVMMGAERRSMVMTEEEKTLTAYHEAGHAMCMLFAEAHEPLHKVTIIPRGRALGVTMFLPERDKYSQSKQEIKAMMTSLFGGRVAEELILRGRQGHHRGGRRYPPRDQSGAPHGHRVRVQRQLGPLRYSEKRKRSSSGIRSRSARTCRTRRRR